MPRQWIAFIIVFCLLSGRLAAQEPVPATPPAPPGPKTLAEALAQVNWAASRGVLLTVNPQGVNSPGSHSADDPTASAISSADQSLPPIPELTSRGYDARALADYFDQEMVREGGITVLAPQTMRVLNTNPGPPDLSVGLPHDEAMTLLEGTLTTAQWKKIGSKEGLGADDLTDDQRQFFQAVLPDPFVVERATTDDSRRKSDPAKTIRLTDAQRAQVRLRVVLQTTAEAKLLTPFSDPDFPFPGQPPQTLHSVLFGSNRDHGPKEFLSLVGDYNPIPPALPYRYGYKLSNDMPNRLKRGELNLDAPGFARAISLQAVNGKLTVADLIQRIAAVSQEELYADPRIGRLSVWARGQSARCTDVLKALCLACTSTFRQVGPAYVLTDDVQGIGARRALIDDWEQDAQAKLSGLDSIARYKQRDDHIEQYMTWADDEPIKLSPAIFKQVTTFTPKANNQDVPLTALTPDQQQFIKDAAAKLGQQENGKYAVNPEHLTVVVSVWQNFIIPDLGEAPIKQIDQLTYFDSGAFKDMIPESLTLPPHRALSLAPANPKEAIQAVQEAHRRRYTALWVQIPDDGSLVSLSAAIHAARRFSLPVYAIVRLMSRPPGTSESTLNILGEPLSVYLDHRPSIDGMGDALPKDPSRDWASLDDPGLFQHLQSTLRTLLKTPGLAGLVFRDMAAPGFDSPSINFSDYPWKGTATQVGYTPDIRLAFLRRCGADPIDIGLDVGYEMSTDLPFFRADVDLVRKWCRFRYEANQTLLARLYATLRHAYPSMPLLVQVWTPGTGWEQNWYGSWDKPNVQPHLQTDIFLEKAIIAAARSQSHQVLFDFHISADDVERHLQRLYLFEWSHMNPSLWDGVVMDLGEIPMSTALPFLDSLTKAPSPTPSGKTP